ncbi:fatty-acyl-CoA synthase [Xylariaceae sp. FL0016]|nr:fatty-acyl-CoA synthase [Xylariaceae sp. FL0016]
MIAGLLMRKQVQSGRILMYHTFEDRAASQQKDDLFLIFEDRQWTYKEFFEALQPVGNWLLKDLGIQKGEVVAVDGTNSPEYLMLWFALEAIGACPAFLNCNLTAKPLVHSIKLSGARYVLADTDIRDLIAPVEEQLAAESVRTVYYNEDIVKTFKDTEKLPKPRQQGLDLMGMSSLMYTSGTTGLPKGVIIGRMRELTILHSTQRYLGLKPGDRMYTCLPLYHAAAHGLCTVPCLGGGSTVVLARKFSHKTFWRDVHASKANIIQYVGELCRYLVNAPPSPLDKGHNVRMAWGNGMRPDVWERFRERFGIECINELYGASDGVGFMANANRGDYTRNALALRGPIWHLLNGRSEKRILIDPDSQEVLRGQDGFAIEVKTDEPGEMISRMNAEDPDMGTPAYYQNQGATLKRRIRDVFAKGDMWYRSGDLFRQDADGRLFFVDRLGDTFRWHSENVSTNEVSDVVGLSPQIAEANVYGVLVPNADGRAGCAAVVPTGGQVDWQALAAHCSANLPRYAVPIFVRLVKELEYTGTMKMQKGRLRSEGIELDSIEKAAKEKGEAVDTMYWLPPGGSAYVPFLKRDLQELKAGRVRL